MKKPLLHIEHEARTQLYPFTYKLVADLDEKLDSMLSKWIFMGKGSGLDLRRVDGSYIRYAERRFHGSPEDEYWGPWLDEYVERDSVTILNGVAEKAQDKRLCLDSSLNEAVNLLCLVIAKTYERKADVAALLSGDGSEQGEHRDMTVQITAMQTAIKQHSAALLAENRRLNSWLCKLPDGGSLMGRINDIWRQFSHGWLKH